MPKPYEYWLYPDLRKFPSADQDEALSRARQSEFDRVELVGIFVALVIVVSLTKYSTTALGPMQRIMAILVNFLVAIPLLTLFAGPFYVRRIRRSLREQLAKKSS